MNNCVSKKKNCPECSDYSQSELPLFLQESIKRLEEGYERYKSDKEKVSWVGESMDLIDFSDCQIMHKNYNGSNGYKLCAVYNDKLYMLKFPSLSKLNPNLHYSNSCISEYIGSYIFEIIGMDVQKTLLGEYKYHEKKYLVVACEDFISSSDYVFQDFASLKNNVIESSRNGFGTELESGKN